VFKLQGTAVVVDCQMLHCKLHVQISLNRVALIYLVLFKPQWTETRSSSQTKLG